MKRKSPISVERVQFYTYERYEEENATFFIDQFPYDGRRDFAVDNNLAGIAVRLVICNERADKGVRRNVKLALVDLTSRCRVAVENIKVNIRKHVIVHEVFVNFPIVSTGLAGGHAYKLIIWDENASEILSESVFNLFDRNILGNPAKWYEIKSGGIKPTWESGTFKVLKTVDVRDYYVRFTLSSKLGSVLPAVLPELEMRLYYPEDKHITVSFNEPKYLGTENFKDKTLTADFPFMTRDEANGIFYAELLCMEYPVAGFVFDTESVAVPGAWVGKEIEPLDEYSPAVASERLNKLLPHATASGLSDKDFDDLLQDFIDSQLAESEAEINEDSSNYDADDEEGGNDESNDLSDDCPKTSLLSSLDHLTGLQNVKNKLKVYENVVMFNKKRSARGLPIVSAPLHAMFLGSPGTGKTTVAKLMGQMLRDAGVLSKGHVVVRERATLLGQFYHSEAEKTRAAIEEAQGGILFIDEAYQLYQPNDPKDPGKFVIETLLTALADESQRDWMLVLAGYPDEMKRMFDMNPGFKSRIPDSNIYIFDDFTESELMEIAKNYFNRNNYTLSPDAGAALAKRLKADYEQREKNFGNARHIINLIQTEILPSMAVRVISEGRDDELSLTEVQMSDIPCPIIKPAPSHTRVGFVR